MRVNTTCCPFCSAAVSGLEAKRPRRFRDLSRIAIVTLGATLGAIGCDAGTADVYGGPPPPMEPDDPDELDDSDQLDDRAAPVYGGPPMPPDLPVPAPEAEDDPDDTPPAP